MLFIFSLSKGYRTTILYGYLCTGETQPKGLPHFKHSRYNNKYINVMEASIISVSTILANIAQTILWLYIVCINPGKYVSASCTVPSTLNDYCNAIFSLVMYYKHI